MLSFLRDFARGQLEIPIAAQIGCTFCNETLHCETQSKDEVTRELSAPPANEQSGVDGNDDLSPMSSTEKLTTVCSRWEEETCDMILPSSQIWLDFVIYTQSYRN